MNTTVTDAMIDAVLEHRREESRKRSENPDYGMCGCVGPIPVRETDGRIPTKRCQCVRSTIAKEIAAALETVRPEEQHAISKAYTHLQSLNTGDLTPGQIAKSLDLAMRGKVTDAAEIIVSFEAYSRYGQDTKSKGDWYIGESS